MKKITQIVAYCFLIGSVALAKSTEENESRGYHAFGVYYENAEPISFIERGIAFYIFPNGTFDFNTRPQDSQGDYFYRSAGNRTLQRRPLDYGVRIEHDSFGRVRRIGNTFINYDFRDRVSRIGSIFMRYNRVALTQVGGLQIIYNRNMEIIDIIGSVHRRQPNYGFIYSNTCQVTGYDTNHNYNFQYGNSYYYRPAQNNATSE